MSYVNYTVPLNENSSVQARELRQRTDQEIRRVAPAFEPNVNFELHCSAGDQLSECEDYNGGDWESVDGDTEQQTLLRQKRRRCSTTAREKYGGSDRITIHVASDIPSTTIKSPLPRGLTEDQLLQELQRLQEQLAAGMQELERTKYDLVLERAKRPNNFDDYYFSDAAISLRSKIRQWAITYFGNEAGYVTRRAANRFQHLTSDFAAYLDSRGFRPWLIQARLWDLLQLQIFDQSSPRRYGYIWTGPTKSQQLDIALREATRSASDIERKEFNEWRALTFNLLFPGEGRKTTPRINIPEITEQAVLIRNKIWKTLRSYAKRIPAKTSSLDAKSALMDIVADAVVLDLDFKKQIVEFTFPRWKRREETSIKQFGYRYKPQSMENMTIRNEERLIVELLVSPALSKRRDPSGRDDEEPTILLKAQVICDHVPRKHLGYLQRGLAPIFTMPPKQTVKQEREHTLSQKFKESGFEDRDHMKRKHARLSLFNDQSSTQSHFS